MDLLKILSEFRRKYQTNQIIFTGLLILSALLLLLILCISLLISRWALFILIPVISILIYRGSVFCSLISISRKLEHYFPELKHKILPAVELLLKHNSVESEALVTRENYSSDLIVAAVKQASEKIRTVLIYRAIDTRKSKISGYTCMFLLLIFISLYFISPVQFRLGWKMIFYRTESLINLEVSPGNIFVNQDSVVQIKYSLSRLSPNLVSHLFVKGNKYETRENEFSISVKADKSFDYFVVINSKYGVPIYKSARYSISLYKPIQITELVFTYHYPAYTKLPNSSTYTNEIRAVIGTKVTFSGKVSTKLERAVRNSSIKSEDLDVSDSQFRGEFTVNQADSFSFSFLSDNRQYGKSHQFNIKPLNDELPFVKMILPGRDIDLPVSMQILIGMYAIDDFGLSRFDLHCFKLTTGDSFLIRLKNVYNKYEDTLLYQWDLNTLNLLPGEEIDYYGVVYDNDAVSGFKSSRTEAYSIRFPTLTEIYNKTTETNQATMSRLAPINESQQQLTRELEKISQHVKQYREMNWEEKTKLDELLSKQEELMSSITSLQQEINNVMSDLYSGLMLDKETMEQLEKISDILNQILPEELKQNIEKLKQALLEKNIDMNKTLENFKMSSEDMKKALQRALELLKRIQKEEQLANLARKAEEIYRQQSQINSRIENEKLDRLASPQNQVGEEISELEHDIRDVHANADDSVIQAELSRIMQELNSMSLENQSHNVSKNLSDNNRGDSKKSASTLLQDLAKLKEELKKLSDMFKKRENEAVSEKMLAVANNLNSISFEQEKIKSGLNRDNLKEMVSRQKRICEAAGIVAETLAQWSEKSLFISPKWTQEIARAITAMENASILLEEAVHANTNQQTIKNLQDAAIYPLNIVTLQILRQLLMSQQSGGMKGGMESLLQALSQITIDQMSLGQGMSGIPIPIPGSLSAEQASQLGRLMSMQSQLRAQMEQLMQDINAGQYGETPGMTGSMQGALEEMAQIEKDLSELNISRQTIERQERVIERLLDAQRSIRQKEYSEKREREIGKDYPERPIIIIDRNLGESNKQLREELLRSMRDGYPKEYEQMIKNYFESLLKE